MRRFSSTGTCAWYAPNALELPSIPSRLIPTATPRSRWILWRDAPCSWWRPPPRGPWYRPTTRLRCRCQRGRPRLELVHVTPRQVDVLPPCFDGLLNIGPLTEFVPRFGR